MGNSVWLRPISIDMNALRAIAYGGDPFSIDMNALWAIAFGSGPFSIDMNALQAIAGISHREMMSIERIRCMYCFVRRTLTTKLEREFFIMNSNFLHHPPSFPLMPESIVETIFFQNLVMIYLFPLCFAKQFLC